MFATQLSLTRWGGRSACEGGRRRLSATAPLPVVMLVSRNHGGFPLILSEISRKIRTFFAFAPARAS